MKEKKSELELLTSILDNKSTTLLNYHKELLALNKIPIELNLIEQFGHLCKRAALIMNISRVSIWLYEEDNSKLVKTHQFNSIQEIVVIVNKFLQKISVLLSRIKGQKYNSCFKRTRTCGCQRVIKKLF